MDYGQNNRVCWLAGCQLGQASLDKFSWKVTGAVLKRALFKWQALYKNFYSHHSCEYALAKPSHMVQLKIRGKGNTLRETLHIAEDADTGWERG